MEDLSSGLGDRGRYVPLFANLEILATINVTNARFPRLEGSTPILDCRAARTYMSMITERITNVEPLYHRCNFIDDSVFATVACDS